MTPSPTIMQEEAPKEEETAAQEETNNRIEIVMQLPPIWKEVHAAFDIDDRSTVYAYGNKIYNPAGIAIPDHVIEHEMVHMWQQKQVGGPEKWWKMYIGDTAFRVSQEIEAYKAQYAFYCTHNRDRNARARFLNDLAGFMASDMYKAAMSRAEAIKAIRG